MVKDGINTAEFDPKSGKCVRHPAIRLRKKKLFGGWKIVIGHCPECCLEEMRRVRDEIGNVDFNHSNNNGNDNDYYDDDYDEEEDEDESRISGRAAGGGRSGGDETDNGDYDDRQLSSASRHRSGGGGGGSKKDKKKNRSGGGERHKERGDRGGERRSRGGGGHHHRDRDRDRDRDRERERDRDRERERDRERDVTKGRGDSNIDAGSIEGGTGGGGGDRRRGDSGRHYDGSLHHQSPPPPQLPHYPQQQQQRTMVLSMAFTDQRTGQRGTYTGQINPINRMPDGKGTVYYSNGSIAEGTWMNGILVESEDDIHGGGAAYPDPRVAGGMIMRGDPPLVPGGSGSSRRPHTVHHPSNTTFSGGNLDQLDRLGGKPRQPQQRGTSSVNSYNSRGSAAGADMNNVLHSGSASVQEYRGAYNTYSPPSVGMGGVGGNGAPYRRTDVGGYHRQHGEHQPGRNPPGYR